MPKKFHLRLISSICMKIKLQFQRIFNVVFHSMLIKNIIALSTFFNEHIYISKQNVQVAIQHNRQFPADVEMQHPPKLPNSQHERRFLPKCYFTL